MKYFYSLLAIVANVALVTNADLLSVADHISNNVDQKVESSDLSSQNLAKNNIEVVDMEDVINDFEDENLDRLDLDDEIDDLDEDNQRANTRNRLFGHRNRRHSHHTSKHHRAKDSARMPPSHPGSHNHHGHRSRGSRSHSYYSHRKHGENIAVDEEIEEGDENLEAQNIEALSYDLDTETEQLLDSQNLAAPSSEDNNKKSKKAKKVVIVRKRAKTSKSTKGRKHSRGHRAKKLSRKTSKASHKQSRHKHHHSDHAKSHKNKALKHFIAENGFSANFAGEEGWTQNDLADERGFIYHSPDYNQRRQRELFRHHAWHRPHHTNHRGFVSSRASHNYDYDDEVAMDFDIDADGYDNSENYDIDEDLPTYNLDDLEFDDEEYAKMPKLPYDPHSYQHHYNYYQ